MPFIGRHPWDRVSIANWIKYPNDLTPHVIHVDYLSRSVDSSGILHTERLLTCCQNVPAFIARLFSGENSSLFYERSEVDREGRTLTLRARNLTFCNLLTVEEVCRYVQDVDGNTRLRQEVGIRCFAGWTHIANAVEEFIVGRFHANARKGRLALEHAIDRIVQETRDQVRELFGEAPIANNASVSASADASPLAIENNM